MVYFWERDGEGVGDVNFDFIQFIAGLGASMILVIHGPSIADMFNVNRRFMVWLGTVFLLF